MSGDSLNGDDLGDQRGENDVELRELVYQSLERDGLITRLKAQLRAAVFKTIEKAANPSDSTHKPAYEGATGRICRALVLDWLEQSHLLYTHDVFRVETSGPNHPPPLTPSELLEHLHLDAAHSKSQPILHALLTQSPARSERLTSLPQHIKQSIDGKFPTEKINDINRVREHFRTLFAAAFDASVLEAFLNRNLSVSSTSMAKIDYEQICLKWMQACAQALTPSAASPVKQPTSIVPLQPLSARTTATNEQAVTRARRALSPPSDSSSSSMSTSISENPRKHVYDFPLPTTLDSSKNGAKKSTDIAPPPLLNFNNSNSANDDDDDTTSSIFSRRNATPAALNHLRNIEDIAGGDVTPRTRTAISKPSANGNKDLPVEYDDESMSQSQISSIDDVTVDKASPSPSAHIDFLEDL